MLIMYLAKYAPQTSRTGIVVQKKLLIYCILFLSYFKGSVKGAKVLEDAAIASDLKEFDYFSLRFIDDNSQTVRKISQNLFFY